MKDNDKLTTLSLAVVLSFITSLTFWYFQPKLDLPDYKEPTVLIGGTQEMKASDALQEVIRLIEASIQEQSQ